MERTVFKVPVSQWKIKPEVLIRIPLDQLQVHVCTVLRLELNFRIFRSNLDVFRAKLRRTPGFESMSIHTVLYM